ncbi:LPXTG cell wall anchor domain-containing protein [Curtobacterium poinsettiae]|nr:LPXTG cell wall anchor domain-containing protein [Curtobacterium flaccumfaciens]MBT1610901.1 LPXTG cell wall anchor domain-containing protein [Curtobacterium flaccumfaciens pv. poinsettiae]MCS6579762.1 LPXTG cell wall anchor domain-containing protein [Curtobacterium flaccumfaciens]UXN20079.1 LPXTG cell wall anchor domain-containing protein [Curtobacterium flaccumfaciens pv. poinsettiae]
MEFSWWTWWGLLLIALTGLGLIRRAAVVSC